MVYKSHEADAGRPDQSPGVELENLMVFKKTVEEALNWFKEHPVPADVLKDSGSVLNYLTELLPAGGLILETEDETTIVLRGVGDMPDPSPNWRLHVNRKTGLIVVED